MNEKPDRDIASELAYDVTYRCKHVHKNTRGACVDCIADMVRNVTKEIKAEALVLIEGLFSDRARLRDALEDMWNQFAYRREVGDDDVVLTSGGLPALENCEDALSINPTPQAQVDIEKECDRMRTALIKIAFSDQAPSYDGDTYWYAEMAEIVAKDVLGGLEGGESEISRLRAALQDAITTVAQSRIAFLGDHRSYSPLISEDQVGRWREALGKAGE